MGMGFAAFKSRLSWLHVLQVAFLGPAKYSWLYCFMVHSPHCFGKVTKPLVITSGSYLATNYEELYPGASGLVQKVILDPDVDT